MNVVDHITECLHIVAVQGSSTGREGAVKTEENHSCPLVVDKQPGQLTGGEIGRLVQAQSLCA